MDECRRELVADAVHRAHVFLGEGDVALTVRVPRLLGQKFAEHVVSPLPMWQGLVVGQEVLPPLVRG